ncbi:MAG: hypothetical protein M1455_06275 [Actinobacteria bacterium]|nr:hypothetical protein [Actinomycetota bacterium]
MIQITLNIEGSALFCAKTAQFSNFYDEAPDTSEKVGEDVRQFVAQFLQARQPKEAK